MYTYKAELVRVVDGDTVDLRVDVGFYWKAIMRFRLLGCDCPEINRKETSAAGKIAKAATELWLQDEKLTIRTEKSDAFGRWLALIYREDDHVSLSDHLIEQGHAVPR